MNWIASLITLSEQVEISATALALRLQAELDDFFDGRVIGVELDPDLIAKAAAGATRIRLRAGAAFSDYDLQQLLQHEAYVLADRAQRPAAAQPRPAWRCRRRA